MAAATSYLAIPKLKPKPFLIVNQSNINKPHHSPKPTSLPITTLKPELTASIAKNAAVLTTVISTLTSSPPIAMAAKKIAESPQQDIRGLAFLVPIIPAVGWALINILGPALNQIERMRTQRAIILGLGFGGLAATAAINWVPSASAASEVVENAAVSGDNNRLYLVLFVAAAAFLEVLFLDSKMKDYESQEKKSFLDPLAPQNAVSQHDLVKL
ncbi:hypothetical protein Cgig2_020256 [Carnegiea gigantea]|uniref:Uncharacterized protein n=1 Tax=Carnegiea gigantea TaxID=171969 RepID=A0A9Q1KVT1_9CARY|nr:hypothetical protein Cgig2_020256 [Carnegiea gigantea]